MAHCLAQEYLAARVEEADRTFRFENVDHPNQFYVLVSETHSNRPLVWVIPNFLTQEEYQSVLEQLEQEQPNAIRTQKLQIRDVFGQGMQELSRELLPRLQLDYNQRKELFRRDESTSGETIHSVSPQWNVVQLEPEEEFPAHRDGMDSQKGDGVFAVSTHSVLLEFYQKEPESYSYAKVEVPDDASASTDSSTSGTSLTTAAEEPSQVGGIQQQGEKGGAIRFYYRQYPFDGPYDYCVDVTLPNGWAIVMEQRPDLWYALQPSHFSSTRRYVAQAGMLQALPNGTTVDSIRKGGRGAFALGPGLLEFFEDEADFCLGETAPRGWGYGRVQPKTTVWRGGRPMIGQVVTSNGEEDSSKERRESRMDLGTLDPSLSPQKRRTSRRQSLQQVIVDPIRQRVSFVANPKLGGKLLETDDTSMTADFSESTSRDDDLMVCFIAAMEERKRQEKEFRQRKGIQVTRKPRRDSLVGKMVESFQGNYADADDSTIG